MATRLPEWIEPLRLAEKGVRLKGEIALSRMPRLGESLFDRSGQVSIDILFSKDVNGIPSAKGLVQARLQLLCQRCMAPMDLDINMELKLELLADEGVINRLKDFDPLYVATGPMSLAGLIEDELILTLPFAPRHTEGQCSLDAQTGVPSIQPVAPGSPFAVLSRLKNSK